MGRTTAFHGRFGEYPTHELVIGREREWKIVLEQGAIESSKIQVTMSRLRMAGLSSTETGYVRVAMRVPSLYSWRLMLLT